MTKEEIRKEIETRRQERIANYYSNIHKAHDEELSAEERAKCMKIADIEYGRVEAFNEAINYLRLK